MCLHGGAFGGLPSFTAWLICHVFHENSRGHHWYSPLTPTHPRLCAPSPSLCVLRCPLFPALPSLSFDRDCWRYLTCLERWTAWEFMTHGPFPDLCHPVTMLWEGRLKIPTPLPQEETNSVEFMLPCSPSGPSGGWNFLWAWLLCFLRPPYSLGNFSQELILNKSCAFTFLFQGLLLRKPHLRHLVS